MAIVGPRPALPREVAQYSAADRLRLLGKPGPTCTWQVSGRADLPFEDQLRLDVDYLHERCLSKDIEFIMRTIPAVVWKRCLLNVPNKGPVMSAILSDFLFCEHQADYGIEVEVLVNH